MISSATNSNGDASKTTNLESASYDPKQFDWPLAYDAEKLLHQRVAHFLELNGFARRLAERMRDETGTDFFEWIDHLVLGLEHAEALRAAGFVPENVEAPAGATVFAHPRAMMPRVLLRAGGGSGDVPSMVALRPESVADFLSAHDFAAPI